MQIKLAKTAGFCFGVDRAVNLIYDLIAQGKKVATLGPIIHNPQLVEELTQKGVVIVSSLSTVPKDFVLVIRTHGIPKKELDAIQASGIDFTNATCPFVSKIHNIVHTECDEKGIVLIAGDAAHPEVQGIQGYCRGASYVFKDKDELSILIKKYASNDKKTIICVAQTTFSTNEWKKCVEILKKVCTNAVIFDTICSATSERQLEATELSKNYDAMIVVGGRHSSNTTKLKEVSSLNCPTFLVETADELHDLDLNKYNLIGVTAGASTPAGIIKEVLQTMSENQETKIEKEVETTTTEESTVADTAELNAKATTEPAVEVSADGDLSFAELLEESLKFVTTDQRVKGTVVRITPSEIQVDVIGRKQSGFVSLEELTSNPGEKPEDIVAVGDVLDLIIMKTNDQEGTIMLSKRRFDAIRGWDDIVAACESQEVLEGIVSAVVRGGLLVNTKGMRVFVPASLATLNRTENFDYLLNTTVSFKIIEVNEQRRRAVASIKAVLRESRKEQEVEFWDNVAEGKVYVGVVKSLTTYGAFVDIGGVDGMVHISELSWKRIKHPSDVVAIGETVEVYVKSFDIEKRKISLGYKKTEDNPWELLRTRFPVNTVVKVKIVSLATFGAFANIMPGIDGLIHISQMTNERIENTAAVLSVGQEVDALITDINYEKRRVSLSMRALLPTEDVSVDTEDTLAYSTETPVPVADDDVEQEVATQE